MLIFFFFFYVVPFIISPPTVTDIIILYQKRQIFNDFLVVLETHENTYIIQNTDFIMLKITQSCGYIFRIFIFI